MHKEKALSSRKYFGLLKRMVIFEKGEKVRVLLKHHGKNYVNENE